MSASKILIHISMNSYARKYTSCRILMMFWFLLITSVGVTMIHTTLILKLSWGVTPVLIKQSCWGGDTLISLWLEMFIVEIPLIQLSTLFFIRFLISDFINDCFLLTSFLCFLQFNNFASWSCRWKVFVSSFQVIGRHLEWMARLMWLRI